MKKICCGLRWLPINILEATTNQKHAVAINNGTKEGCDWQGMGGKRDSFVLGAIKLGGDKKLNKIDEFTN
jgi:hypothetical protein